NEAMRHVQNDARRVMNVRRELYNPAAGESKFSTGNLKTLAKADATAVRAFYEAHYSADRMALALAGTASLDELEKYARASFAAIPKRDLPAVTREPIFLPRKAALRLATIEPVKDIRQLGLEFVMPATRPDFASKSDELLSNLLNYPGKGGLVQYLKDAGLATAVSAGNWERTPNYGSMFINVDLTPAGEKANQRVLEAIFGYIDHLRNAPFPAEFYQDQARIAGLKETFEDRGEGAPLVTELANQALFYPLEVAERAPFVWGQPDEAAYRKLLGALTPDNLLVTLAAKGVPTDQTEEIYGTQYAYTETTGEKYNALRQPPVIADFALPGANPFLPTTTALVAERPLRLIDSNTVSLYYAADIEFQRPQTTLIFRFVPRRTTATLENALLLRFYQTCLEDALEPAAGDAALAGVTYALSLGLEGFKLTVSGFGDSPVRFAQRVADTLLKFDVTPERFVVLQEKIIRNLRSYEQTEAYQLARDRAAAVLKEFDYLPDQHLARAPSVTWRETRDLARKYFATGKLETLVHGHITPEAAKEAVMNFKAKLHFKPVNEENLLRRRHLALQDGQMVIDTGAIAGANSAIWQLCLLPDDLPDTRAAAKVLANFINEPFYTELRTKQQLGYIVGAGDSASLRQYLQLFVIQSSAYAPDELRARADAFLATAPGLFDALPEAQFATLKAGVRSELAEKPKSIAEKAAQMFALAYDYDGDWERREETLAALEKVTKAEVAALLQTVVDPAKARRILVLLSGPEHAPSAARADFTDRDAWKATQSYQ
ncbi:MAG: insulinase family protein, partial [Opitutaceae bacterium]|nr:insulinase family protein [Opitutaceae bacterium]